MGRSRATLTAPVPIEHAAGEADIPQSEQSATPWFAVALLGLCSAVVAALGLDITHDGRLSRVDHRLARWAYSDVSFGLHTWLVRLTHLGDARWLAGVIFVAVAWLLYRRRLHDALLLCCAGAVTGLVTTGLKLAFHRSRPPFVDPADVQRSFSFPSGHTSGAFTVYVLAALLVTAAARRLWQAAAVAAALVLASFIAVTRILIPVHYLTDVLAGGAVGLGIVAVAWLARMALQRGS